MAHLPGQLQGSRSMIRVASPYGGGGLSCGVSPTPAPLAAMGTPVQHSRGVLTAPRGASPLGMPLRPASPMAGVAPRAASPFGTAPAPQQQQQPRVAARSRSPLGHQPSAVTTMAPAPTAAVPAPLPFRSVHTVRPPVTAPQSALPTAAPADGRDYRKSPRMQSRSPSCDRREAAASQAAQSAAWASSAPRRALSPHGAAPIVQGQARRAAVPMTVGINHQPPLVHGQLQRSTLPAGSSARSHSQLSNRSSSPVLVASRSTLGTKPVLPTRLRSGSPQPAASQQPAPVTVAHVEPSPQPPRPARALSPLLPLRPAGRPQSPLVQPELTQRPARQLSPQPAPHPQPQRRQDWPSSPIAGSSQRTARSAAPVLPQQVADGYRGAQEVAPLVPPATHDVGSHSPYSPGDAVCKTPSAEPPMVSSDDAGELRQGQVVRIDTVDLVIKEVLGMGSFGVVWRGEELVDPRRRRAVAIKEILCITHADLQNARFERELLKMNEKRSRDVEDDSSSRSSDDADFSGFPADCSDRIPVLVASDTVVVAEGQWRVRLAMTMLKGRALDHWLDQIDGDRGQRDHERCRKRPGDFVARAGLSYLAKDIAQASSYTRELLRQLAPVMECISRVAVHRDVDPHNILIDCEDDVPSFGLVDFGLAVDKICWRKEPGWNDRLSRVGADGSSTWHMLDVGGDCRYWPVSAWVQFLHGFTVLEEQAPLNYEYLVGLDLHSLGLAALQLFVSLLPRLRDFDRLELDWQATPHSLLLALENLQRSWSAYWEFITPLHSDLMKTYNGAGSWDELKMRCMDEEVGEVLGQRLVEIRSLLRELKKVSAATHFGEISQVCSALLLTIGSGGGDGEAGGSTGGTWTQAPHRWRQVLRAAGGRRGVAGAAGGASAGGPRHGAASPAPPPPGARGRTGGASREPVPREVPMRVSLNGTVAARPQPQPRRAFSGGREVSPQASRAHG
eukprot:TRINITY_DN20846_c1_g1_i1.p1 TRINITY_DN20846_c1_g1~~TRINITY_DN20846_c1_g1_i1.p1  ORF type:complete len:959 (+),score=187.39 TRINITY_DN20846_c1_g1_i1:70-2946(+)